MFLAAAFVLIFLLHLPLLRLPYFWDEAGYYIPAARDLLSGSPIPYSTPSNAHPPLVMAWLALGWKIFGQGQLVTRCAMLLRQDEREDESVESHGLLPGMNQGVTGAATMGADVGSFSVNVELSPAPLTM